MKLLKHYYRIIYHDTIGKLSDEVNNFLAKGWLPLGGVALQPDKKAPNGVIYVQAIYVSEENYKQFRPVPR